MLVGAPCIGAGGAALPESNVESREGDIAEIESIWSAFLTAAQTGDKEAALEFFNPVKRSTNRETFDAMGDFFLDFVNNAVASEFIPIEISDDVALFALTPPCEETDKSRCETFPIYFVNHPDLGWRLSQL